MIYRGIICVIYTWVHLFFFLNLASLLSLHFVPSASISLSLCCSSSCTYVMLLNKGRPLHPDQGSGERVGRKEAKWGRKGRDEQNFNELSLMTARSSVMVTQHCRSVAGWSRIPRIWVLRVGRVEGKHGNEKYVGVMGTFSAGLPPTSSDDRDLFARSPLPLLPTCHYWHCTWKGDPLTCANHMFLQHQHLVGIWKRRPCCRYSDGPPFIICHNLISTPPFIYSKSFKVPNQSLACIHFSSIDNLKCFMT